MKTYDSTIIGHVSKDINIDCEGNTVTMYGGAVLFSSAAAYALGHKVAAITKVADSDKDRINAFVIPQEDVCILPAQKNTSIRNQYLTPDKERRVCTCISQGDSFGIADIPQDISAKIYHFAGLIYGDFPDNLIRACAEKGDVALDVQTCLRHADAQSGNMYFEDWRSKKDLLPLVRYLKTDAAEAEIMTGAADRFEAAKILYGYGAKEILITHNTEVLAYAGDEFYTCPIRARNLSGRTGRGDTTFAAYINERLQHGMKDALLTATALVSLKMETPGQFRGTRDDLNAYISAFYGDLRG